MGSCRLPQRTCLLEMSAESTLSAAGIIPPKPTAAHAVEDGPDVADVTRWPHRSTLVPAPGLGRLLVVGEVPPLAFVRFIHETGFSELCELPSP